MGVGVAAAIGGAAALGGSIFSGVMGKAGSKEQADAIKYSANQAKETALELTIAPVAMWRPSDSTGSRPATCSRRF